MKFLVHGDDRGGRVSVQADTGSDPREETYTIDPGENEYAPIDRRLSQQDGSGKSEITVSLETSSEFVDYARGECTGLRLSSKGRIELPQDPDAEALGIVQDRISMGIRIDRPGNVKLTASIASDVDVAEIRFEGPSFDAPIRIHDGYSQTLAIPTPGEYTLQGAYQLSVQLPNSGLGGRPVTVELQATLDPA